MLANPLEGTFDLSQCGDAAKYICISTGYRKGKKETNRNKIEIWITPRFLIEKELNTTSQQYKTIMDPTEWPTSKPLGIFWNLGDEGGYFGDYLVNNEFWHSYDWRGNKRTPDNFYDKWRESKRGTAGSYALQTVLQGNNTLWCNYQGNHKTLQCFFMTE